MTAPTGFQAFLDSVNVLPADRKAAAADSYYNGLQATPLLEGDTMAIYLYDGQATSVNMSGDANDWDSIGTPLQNLAGTNLWYLVSSYENDARLDYKFILNHFAWSLDPRNPNQIPGEFGTNSELRMPGYAPGPEMAFYPDIPHGALINYNITSNYVASRSLRIYLPPTYTAGGSDSYPLVLFHDGAEYLTYGLANNTLDYCIQHQTMNPVIGVFIPPVDRANEYIGTEQDAFVSFISLELLPYIRSQYRVAAGPANCATVGISNGGDISQHLGLKLSSQIGKVGCFSPDCAWNLGGYLALPGKLNLTFYLDAGTYDLTGFLDGNRSFVSQVLLGQGYPYQFNVYHQGHSWGSWRDHLHHALERLFPPS